MTKKNTTTKATEQQQTQRRAQRELVAIEAELRMMREAVWADGKTANSEFLGDLYAMLDSCAVRLGAVTESLEAHPADGVAS